jgi:hypothetical protein
VVQQHQFHDRIAQLVHTFPEDAVTSTGALFWSAPKRFPRPIKFDGGDKSHVTLCRAAAILKAEACGIELPAWYNSLGKVILHNHILSFAPKLFYFPKWIHLGAGHERLVFAPS